MAALSQSNGPHPTSLSLDRLSRSVNPRVCPVTNTRGASLTVTPGSASLSICSSFSTLFSQFQFPSRSTSTEILELTRLESSKSLVGIVFGIASNLRTCSRRTGVSTVLGLRAPDRGTAPRPFGFGTLRGHSVVSDIQTLHVPRYLYT